MTLSTFLARWARVSISPESTASHSTSEALSFHSPCQLDRPKSTKWNCFIERNRSAAFIALASSSLILWYRAGVSICLQWPSCGWHPWSFLHSVWSCPGSRAGCREQGDCWDKLGQLWKLNFLTLEFLWLQMKISLKAAWNTLQNGNFYWGAKNSGLCLQLHSLTVACVLFYHSFTRWQRNLIWSSRTSL